MTNNHRGFLGSVHRLRLRLHKLWRHCLRPFTLSESKHENKNFLWSLWLLDVTTKFDDSRTVHWSGQTLSRSPSLSVTGPLSLIYTKRLRLSLRRGTFILILDWCELNVWNAIDPSLSNGAVAFADGCCTSTYRKCPFYHLHACNLV